MFRATAEQVLNHLLPALAFGEMKNLKVDVKHYERPYWETLSEDESAPEQHQRLAAEHRVPVVASPCGVGLELSRSRACSAAG